MTTSAVRSSSLAAGASGTQSKNSNFNLKPEDFINMMITQLQNQDPLQPTSSQDLLGQMSQIGQLQSSTLLQDSLKSFMLQSQIAAAGNLIGKTVQGMDDANNTVSGAVQSVRVQAGSIYLALDSGATLGLNRVTAITPGATTTGPATTGLATTGPASAAIKTSP